MTTGLPEAQLVLGQLSNIFKHLNYLNVGLQGRDKTVIDLVEKMHTFHLKLDLFATDLRTGRLLHFPMLRKCISSPAQLTDVMTDFIARLKENFAARLDGLALPTEVMGFVRDPFTAASDINLALKVQQCSGVMLTYTSSPTLRK